MSSSTFRIRVGIPTSSMIGTMKEGLGVYLEGLLRELPSFAGEAEFVVFVPRSHRPLFRLDDRSFQVVLSRNFTNRPTWNILWHWFVLPVLVRRHRITVLHLPEFRRFPLVKPCPILLTIHDLVNVRIPERTRGLRRLYGWALRRFFVGMADSYCVVSENTRRDAVELLNLPPERIAVIPNGVDPIFRPYSREHCLAAAGHLDLPSQFLLCVARLEHPQKNHVTLLRAMAALRNEGSDPGPLILVGRRWTGAEVIFQTITQLGLQDAVRWLDYVPRELLPALYNLARVFIFPSLYEGFGLPVLEAMACGTPVVAADNSSLREVVGSAGLLFRTTDPADLKEKLRQVLTDRALAADLRAKGLRQAAHFTWSQSARLTFALYRQLASGQGLAQDTLARKASLG